MNCLLLQHQLWDESIVNIGDLIPNLYIISQYVSSDNHANKHKINKLVITGINLCKQ